MVKADFITGLVLVVLGIAVVVESVRMPRFENLDVNPYTIPGLVPGVLGVVILLLGGCLCLRAARAGGWRLGVKGGAWVHDPATHRLVLAVILCLGYAAGLVGWLPFWLATALFVTLFVALFEWPLATSAADRAKRLAFAVAFGLAISAAVSLVFQEVFLVRLP